MTVESEKVVPVLCKTWVSADCIVLVERDLKRFLLCHMPCTCSYLFAKAWLPNVLEVSGCM